MISNAAREGFNQLLKQAIQAGLPGTASNCEIAEVSDPTAIEAKKIVMLTISSLLFRAVVLIYFNLDTFTKTFFSRSRGITETEMTDQTLHDVIAEYGNMCCGRLNRDLGNHFHHIGMSTPNIIDRRCSAFLDMLRCGHAAHFRVDTEGGYQFHVSLGVCNYANLDFEVETHDEMAHTGVLEFF